MSQYKLLALDMDGTLLNSKKEITEHTYQALERANEAGCQVCLSTGRGFAELKDYERQMDILSHGILISGGCIYDFHNQEVLSQRTIEREFIEQIVAAIADRDIMVQVLNQTLSVVEKSILSRMEDFYMGVYTPMYERVTTKVDDIRDFLLHSGEDATKINLYHRSPKEREKTLQLLKDLPLSFAYSEQTSLEITPQNIDKGAGLKFLCEKLSISPDEVIAVGDADNDLPILREAGLSVAMGNANDHVKELADVVTGDNDHDGIAEIVERYIL